MYLLSLFALAETTSSHTVVSAQRAVAFSITWPILGTTTAAAVLSPQTAQGFAVAQTTPF